MVFKIVFASVLILFYSGCAQKQNEAPDKMQKHIVQSDKLRILMRDLDTLIYDKYKSELERDESRRRYAFKISSRIKDVSSLLKNMEESKIESFSEYTKELQKKGEYIENIAQKYELENLENAFLDETNM